MRPLAEDTPIEVERIQVEILRRMTPAQKMERMVSLNRSVRSIAQASVRRKYPNASAREVTMRVASRWLPAELMVKAFGWDPRAEGY